MSFRSAWGGAAARQASAATAISIGATLSEAEKSGDQERLTQARNKVDMVPIIIINYSN